MILPFSSRRSRTSLSSNCLYCASLTPRAMFSKSMNIASLRSPFNRSPLLTAPSRGTAVSIIWPPRDGLAKVYSGQHDEEAERSGRGGARAARPAADREVAGTHLRADAALRPRPLDVPLLRPRRA